MKPKQAKGIQDSKKCRTGRVAATWCGIVVARLYRLTLNRDEVVKPPCYVPLFARVSGTGGFMLRAGTVRGKLVFDRISAIGTVRRKLLDGGLLVN